MIASRRTSADVILAKIETKFMKPLLSVSLSDDNGNPRIDWTTQSPGTPLQAAQVDTLIAALASLRETMQPPVKPQDPFGEPVKGVIDPRWWVQADQLVSGGAILMARHPGLGWLALSLPLESVRGIHESLGKILALAQSTTPGSDTLN
jgi:hypothetical protein